MKVIAARSPEERTRSATAAGRFLASGWSTMCPSGKWEARAVTRVRARSGSFSARMGMAALAKKSNCWSGLTVASARVRSMSQASAGWRRARQRQSACSPLKSKIGWRANVHKNHRVPGPSRVPLFRHRVLPGGLVRSCGAAWLDTEAIPNLVTVGSKSYDHMALICLQGRCTFMRKYVAVSLVEEACAVNLALPWLVKR